MPIHRSNQSSNLPLWLFVKRVSLSSSLSNPEKNTVNHNLCSPAVESGSEDVVLCSAAEVTEQLPFDDSVSTQETS